jgi:prophage tail gpP-like protein
VTAPELDKVTLVTALAGREFSAWTSMELSDDFLTPCQTVKLDVGADETRFDLVRELRHGDGFVVYVNDQPQCSGFIDRVSVSYDGHSGTKISVAGSDGLSRMVRGNVDPRMQVGDKMTVEQLVEKVCKEQFGYDYAIFDSFNAGRELCVGKAIKTKTTKRRKKLTDKLENIRPHDNEGAFGYLMRILHRVGLHMWFQPDGKGVVLSGPEYEQSPSYDLVNRITGDRSANNILSAESTVDVTGVPSHVWVRGKDGKPGPKSKMIGFYDNSPNTSGNFVPFYAKDDESSSKEHCDSVAAYIVGKAMKDFLTYSCKTRGFSNASTGAIYNVDTVVKLDDERAGVGGPMWVESRTLRKDRGSGTTTDLKLLPANALILEYLLTESPPTPIEDYKKALQSVQKYDGQPAPSEAAYISNWINPESAKGN